MRHSLVATFFLAVILVSSQSLRAREFSVITYNVENLFDADKVAIFDDYAETGEPGSYGPEKLLGKIQTITRVLQSFNAGQGPEIACFNEFEMDFTPDTKVTDYAAFLEKYKGTTVDKMLTTGLNDDIRGLPVEALLLKHLEDNGLKGYRVVIGGDQPDFAAMASTDRGVHKKGHKNVIFSKFPVKDTRSHPSPDARDILEATRDVEGHPFTIFVNHWKSGASDFGSEQTRRFNAKTLRDRLDEILRENKSADILIVGDFNSNYNQSQAYPFMGQTGLNDVLGSQGDEAATASATGFSLYNLWYELPPAQRRSDQYSGNWGTLIQNMITPGLYDMSGIQYADNSFRVVMLDGVNTRTALKLPHRWTNAGKGSGASDHFPVAASFRTVGGSDTAKRMTLKSPGKNDGSAEPLKVGFANVKPDQVPEFTPQVVADIDRSIGEIFRVKGTISSRRPLTVDAHGGSYKIWFGDAEWRKLASPYKKGSEIEFMAVLEMQKGQLQFLIADPSWLISQPPSAPH